MSQCHMQEDCRGTSPVVQWVRVHLPMQGTQVRSLVWGLRSHMQQSNNARVLLSPRALEPVLHNKRNHRGEKPVRHS